KNLNPLSAFLIRFTYDSTIMRPYQLDYQSERKELDNYRKAMNLDLRNVVYDSTTFSGHGLNTISIDTSGRYCYPFYDDNTTFNAYAFHHPNDDSMHVETVFILFYPPMPPWDECHLNYWSEPLVTPQEDTVKTFANVLFQVESDVLPGTIGNITVCNYIQASPTDPISDLRDNQFTDTDATGYIFPDEGLGSGQIHIQEYVSYCGNIDGTAGIDILDIVCLINFIYKQGTAPIPLSSANVDGIPSIDILDIVHLVNFVYKNGPNPNCQ
ncbi:MAG: hypothetical protein GY865_04955, partial [candidate division Zixibacteria bacterium]|nr:hypothetical protein [candidate division Zixibacteria bacterium]